MLPGIVWDWAPSEGRGLGVPSSCGVEGKARHSQRLHLVVLTTKIKDKHRQGCQSKISLQGGTTAGVGEPPLSRPVFCAAFRLLYFPLSDRPLKPPWGLRGEQGEGTVRIRETYSGARLPNCEARHRLCEAKPERGPLFQKLILALSRGPLGISGKD